MFRVAWDVLPKIKKALETHCPPALYTNVDSQPCGNVSTNVATIMLLSLAAPNPGPVAH